MSEIGGHVYSGLVVAVALAALTDLGLAWPGLGIYFIFSAAHVAGWR